MDARGRESDSADVFRIVRTMPLDRVREAAGKLISFGLITGKIDDPASI